MNKSCQNCTYIAVSGGSIDEPYRDAYCVLGKWSGVSDCYADLDETTDCKSFDWDYLSWISNWILEIISIETIRKYDFDEWINGFKYRYSKNEIDTMSAVWKVRKATDQNLMDMEK